MISPEDCAELASAPTSTLRVIGYVGPQGLGGHRLTFSTAAQAIKQLAGIIARREGRTVEIEEIFSDEPLSDGQTWDGAEQMIHRVKGGGVGALVACTLAHLVRSPTKFLAFCEFLASHRVRLLTVVEHVDTAQLLPADLAEYARTAFRESGIRAVSEVLIRRPTTANG